MMKSRLFLCFFGGWGQRSYAYLFRGRWESLEMRLDEEYNVVSHLLGIYRLYGHQFVWFARTLCDVYHSLL